MVAVDLIQPIDDGTADKVVPPNDGWIFVFGQELIPELIQGLDGRTEGVDRFGEKLIGAENFVGADGGDLVRSEFGHFISPLVGGGYYNITVGA